MKIKLFKRLKKTLGEHDAVNEFIELIVRDFKGTYSVDGLEKDFLEKKSLEHNIYITSFDSDLLFRKIRLNYIVSVHQCLEMFLREINDEAKDLGMYKWNYRTEDKSWLICVVENIFSDINIVDFHDLISVCEYYRHVRNVAVHDFYDDADKEFKKIDKYISKLRSRYPNLNAPNKIQDIGFDDFILFSRAAKEIAQSIINHFRYDPNKILNNNDFVKFKKFKNNPDRLKKAIKLALVSKYDLDTNTLSKSINKIYDDIMAR
ncbi:MAG: hypothetical protein FH756_10220 [Firmicutes bacterium]|nr:hypothetical protein [Bacillota bacterium]